MLTAPGLLSRGIVMTAFNVVRFRVKPGRDQEFLDAHFKLARLEEGQHYQDGRPDLLHYRGMGGHNRLGRSAAEYDCYTQLVSGYA
jgi:hypothetical protein